MLMMLERSNALPQLSPASHEVFLKDCMDYFGSLKKGDAHPSGTERSEHEYLAFGRKPDEMPSFGSKHRLQIAKRNFSTVRELID